MIKKAWSLRFSEVKAWLKELEFDKFDLVLMLLLFLMGRAHLPGGMVPFGLPALAAALMSARCKMIPGVSAAYFLAAALGTLTLGNGWQFFIFSISAVIFYAVMMFDTRVTESARTDNGKYKLPLGIKAGAVLLAAQPVPMIIAVSAGADNVKQAILLLFQAAIGFIAFYIFRTVVQVFSDNISRKLMSNEEMACLAITFAVLVLGLPDIVLLGLSLRRVICVSIIMIFAYRGGLGTGAACGITVGALLAASDMGEFSTVTVGLFGFCGFLSGLLNRFGKIGVGAGFLLGNLIFSPMVTMSADLIMSLFEIGFAITAFFILPEKATKFLKLPQLTGVHIPTVKVNYAEKLRNTAIARLSGFGEILREMSNVCVELTERQGGDPEKSDLMNAMNRITGNVCSRCIMRNDCWERNFYQTYKNFLSILTTLEIHGTVKPGDIPAALGGKYARTSQIISECKNALEIGRAEAIWKRRLEESRKLIPAQLMGMASILESLSREVDMSVRFMDNMEKDIIREFRKRELRIRNVTVCRNRYGRYECHAEVKCCDGEQEQRMCFNEYAAIISDVLGSQMTPGEECCKNGVWEESNEAKLWCKMSFYEAEPLRTCVGVACTPAYGSVVTGDSHSYLSIDRGIQMAALSDGMGTGEQASRQSKSVIRLLELFMESGLEKSVAVSMINALLENGTGEKELSATVDMAVFDLYEGRVSFLKLGAMPALIKREERIETVKVANLPIGLAPVDEPVHAVERKVGNGDYVIMMTDGVGEAYRRAGVKDAEFYGFIEQVATGAPQEVAEKIIKNALDISSNKPKDDMLVMVTKVVA